MRITIDSVGRLVVPKSLRDELGITGPTELESVARDGMIELAVADIPARVEDRPGGAVITTDVPMPPLTTDDVRAAIDRIRRWITPDSSVTIAAAAPWHLGAPIRGQAMAAASRR